MPAFLEFLAAWTVYVAQEQDAEGPDTEESDAARMAFGKELKASLKALDPAAFRGWGTWWSRVYEEVEAGLI